MEKKEPDTLWYKAYRKLAQEFADFITSNHPATSAWKGSANAEEYWKGQLSKSYSEKSGVAVTAGATSVDAKKPVAEAGPVAKKEEVKKTPVRERKGKQWTVMY